MPHSKTLEFDNSRHLAQLYCGDAKNLTKIEESLLVRITSRDNWVQIDGDEAQVVLAEHLFEHLQ